MVVGHGRGGEWWRGGCWGWGVVVGGGWWWLVVVVGGGWWWVVVGVGGWWWVDVVGGGGWWLSRKMAASLTWEVLDHLFGLLIST